jgi:Ca2+-binding EF-hand superfamily protein
MAAEAASPADIAREKVAALNLTAEQTAQYRRKFDSFDLNKDGVISLREFAAVSKVFGYHLTKDEILVCSRTRTLSSFLF